MRFELTLDEVSCSLPPCSSTLGRLPIVSSLCRVDWRALLGTGKLKRLDPKPLEPVLYPLSTVLHSGELLRNWYD